MRIVRATLFVMLVSMALALAACGSNVKDLPVQTIVDNANKKMAGVTTFHLVLDKVGTLNVFGTALDINNVEGDVVKPDRLHVSMKAKLLSVLVDLQVINVGKQTYLTNPTNPNQWVKLSVESNPIAFFNPVNGITTILGQMRDVKKVGVDTVDGVPSYHLQGTTEGPAKQALFGNLAGPDPITTDFWVDSKDFYVRKMKFTGSFLAGEPKNTVRNLSLSKFDEKVSIEPPM